MAGHLKNLDYRIVQQCMHCGLCLPTCPTYDATHVERNSPRGRIALMRAIADGQLEATRTFCEEMYFCLGCLACQTACPAGVNYAELFERARADVEQSGALDSAKRSAIRRVALDWLFSDLRRLRMLGRGLRLYQRSGMQRLVRRSGALKLLPKRLQALESQTPAIQPEFSAERIREVTPAAGTRRFRVAMLTGCAQDLIYSDVNRDTVEVLARNGCEVISHAQQHCCGSIFAHNGELEAAQRLARRNLDQFPPADFDAIISNAGGCGSHLKHFSRLLAGDPHYLARAEAWDRKVRDVHEWLVEIGFEPVRPAMRDEPVTVTYHESCHLCHGQKITMQPRQILSSLPGVRLIELTESSWCCGSAGIYNLIQPEMAGQLLQRKLDHIVSTGAHTVATANPGCLLQLENGARERGIRLRIVHPITLLAEAYRNSSRT
ncbi:MAG TPA: (Fe-S)-binding protein [Verrucomicrobiae bacterium]|nr:(Fe-S)-binding protein [Verrucomicrobiae bacterium]